MTSLKIFISSTMDDMEEERAMLVKAIKRNNYWKPVYAEAFEADSEAAIPKCLRNVKECQIYVGVFKEKYGYVPEKNNPDQISIVEMEYKEVNIRDQEKLIFVDNRVSLRDEKLDEFIKRLKDPHDGHWVKTYNSIDDLVDKCLDSINKYQVKRLPEVGQQRENSSFRNSYYDRLRERFK